MSEDGKASFRATKNEKKKNNRRTGNDESYGGETKAVHQVQTNGKSPAKWVPLLLHVIVRP